MKRVSIAEFLTLSVPERIRLVQSLWDSIAEVPGSLAVTAGEREELDRRLTAYYDRPTEGSPWAEVAKRIKRKK